MDGVRTSLVDSEPRPQEQDTPLPGQNFTWDEITQVGFFILAQSQLNVFAVSYLYQVLPLTISVSYYNRTYIWYCGAEITADGSLRYSE
jgi:hypothetical protein